MSPTRAQQAVRYSAHGYIVREEMSDKKKAETKIDKSSKETEGEKLKMVCLNCVRDSALAFFWILLKQIRHFPSIFPHAVAVTAARRA